MSHPATDAATADATRRKFLSAYDDPGTPDEITRRTFMANATLAIGGIIGLGLVIPIVGSLVPTGKGAGPTWSPLNAQEWKALQQSTDKPVKITFTMKYTDAYLPEQSLTQFVWGIKTSEEKLRKARPELFEKPPVGVPYPVVNMGFTVFSPICPHLGCWYNWNAATNMFACPCHGSTFTFEGKHQGGPAPRGLDPLPLREQSGQAEVTWIRYDKANPDRIVISYTS